MPEQKPRNQSLHCALDPARAAALHITLDRPGAPPKAGDPLPTFWHQIYFWDPTRPNDLGPDGHPKTGRGLIPDLGLPNRMWAGGRLTFHAPLRLGTCAVKESVVQAVSEKTGRSGRLGFVTLRHEISQNGMLCVTEEQDLVYRAPPSQRIPRGAPAAPQDEEEQRALTFTSTLLFRYSALTFNGHRIHYDADYARTTEGYADLVPHGPLLAQELIHLAETALGPLQRFAFRATSALCLGETAWLCRLGTSLWVRGEDGRLCMTAEATPDADLYHNEADDGIEPLIVNGISTESREG